MIRHLVFIAVAVLSAASALPAQTTSLKGAYQSGANTLFYLPMDSPDAGAPEGCTTNNPGLLTYVADRFGNPNKAIHVAGTGSASDSFFISCQNTQIAASASTSITVGYWIRITQSIPAGGNCAVSSGVCGYRNLTILSSNGTNGGCDKYLVAEVRFGNTPGAFPSACSSGNGEFASPDSIADGNWHNLIWVFDYTSQLFTFYLDGIQNSQGPLAAPSLSAANAQWIGGAENGSFALNGDMDDLWMENHAWTPAEVANYLPPPTVNQASLDPGPWPTLSHDNQRTNRSGLSGPVSPGIPSLLYDAGSPVSLNYVTVTSDGKTLLSSCTPQIIALDINGKPLGTPWPFALLPTAYPGSPETPFGGVTVSADGHTYVATHECPDISGGVPAHFYSIKADGTSESNWPVISRAMYYASAIGSDGTVFQMDEFNVVNAYHPDGALFWSVGLPGFSQGAIALDDADNLYIGTDGPAYGGHTVFSFTSSGSLRAGWPQDANGVVASTTAAVATGNIIYIATPTTGALYGFNSDGTPRPGFPYGAGGTASSALPLALSALGTIYMKTSLGLFAVSPDGTSAWGKPFFPGGDPSLSPSPLVDSNGAIFVAFGDKVYSLNPDGSVRPGWPVTVPSAGYMAIGGEGVLLVVSAGQKLYSITGVNTVSTPVIPPTQPLPLKGSGPGGLSQQATASEPVSTGNGNFYYQHTDFSIPARGLPILFQRNYNAIDTFAGPLGANWNHDYNISLSQTSSGVATIRWGDGHGETYTLTGGTYIPQAGVYSTLTPHSDGTFTLVQKNLTKYTFSTSGALTAIVDRNGNLIQLSYDGGGRLVGIANGASRSLVLSYDANNRIIGVSDPIGRNVSYGYSNSNDLTTVTDVAGGVTQYAYDTSHHVASIVRPDGTTLLQNTYDAQGRVIIQANGRASAWSFAYNSPSAGQTTITDARGNKTVHTYDGSLRIVGIMDAQGHTTSYAYDTNNNRTSVTDRNARTTSITYDSRGNITSATNAMGGVSTFSYDAQNNLLTAIDPKGNTISFTYDLLGNLTSNRDAIGNTSTFAYDGFGQFASATDAEGHTSSFTFTPVGDLASVTDALGESTALAYDGIGRLISISDPNLHVRTNSYDVLGRLTKTSDALGNATQFAFDQVGNLTKIIDANGHSTTYGYDSDSNLITVTDALGYTTRYGYDANNNRITFANAKGSTTTYSYDTLDRMIRVTDPLSFSALYLYDPNGNVNTVTDRKGQTNQFVYDANNRLAGIHYADGKRVAYSYDANGNRLSMLDSLGTTTYVYDALNRLIAVTNPASKKLQYAYDALGNRLSTTYPDAKVQTYFYDAASRLSRVTDWLGRATKYTYDSAGNPISTAYPTGYGMTFAFDAANRLKQITNTEKGIPATLITYSLDPVGNRIAMSFAGIPTSFTYDALNQLLSAKGLPYPATWRYDPVGNRIQQSSISGATTYSYDADDHMLTAGTRKFEYDADGNQTTVTNTASRQTMTFTYNAANRLIAAAGAKNSAFTYDGDGNRTSQTVGKNTYAYVNDIAASLPVVLQESGPDGNITYAYGHDLIQVYSPSFNYFYQFDGQGNVVGLTNAKGIPLGAYAYDAWGNASLVLSDDVGTKNKFRFTGEALDPGTSLYYLRARYYDPSVGRFTSRDPLAGLAAHPLTLNRYQYSLGNPIRYTDPSGLSSTSNTGIASIADSCGTNCQMIVGNLLDSLKSIAGSLLEIFQTGPSAATSPNPSDSVVGTVSSVVINPDTVQSQIGAVQFQDQHIAEVAGLVSDGGFTVSQALSFLRVHNYFPGQTDSVLRAQIWAAALRNSPNLSPSLNQ